MDISSLSPSQLHDLDLATGGQVMALLHDAMIDGPFTYADVCVEFRGLGYRIDLVFGSGRDGCPGIMTRLVVEDAHALPERVRIGLVIMQVECFQAAVAERRRQSEARVARVIAGRARNG